MATWQTVKQFNVFYWYFGGNKIIKTHIPIVIWCFFYSICILKTQDCQLTSARDMQIIFSASISYSLSLSESFGPKIPAKC